MILLKSLPTIGPSVVRAAIITIATNIIIKAYSTIPCPISVRLIFMVSPPSLRIYKVKVVNFIVMIFA